METMSILDLMEFYALSYDETMEFFNLEGTD